MTTRLLSVADVAESLGCSRGHVYGLIGTGALTPINITAGKRSKTRIRESDVEAFIDSRTEPIGRRSTR